MLIRREEMLAKYLPPTHNHMIIKLVSTNKSVLNTYLKVIKFININLLLGNAADTNRTVEMHVRKLIGVSIRKYTGGASRTSDGALRP